ncbi:MAG: aldolase/citrate lyase family protein [Hyphomicrobiaceae bacterium]
MALISNPTRERLKKGEVAIGVGLRQARTVDIAPIMRESGYDWLFVDLEHASMDLDMATQISVAALGAGISSLVRVPRGRYDLATRVLDGGAWGIVMPHVDTAEEAREIVDKLRYPPAGHRSVYGAMPQIGFASMPMAEAAATINANMLIVCMLESPTAIANADAIAAVPGVDALLIGSSDLTMEMGLPGQFYHPDVVKAFESMIAACRKHGKWAGIGGNYSEEGFRKYIGMGVRLVLAGSDLGFMMAGARGTTKLIRSIG